MKTTIAKGLLSVKAVSLNVKEPYTWASGIKSPIYCDNRITLSYPKLRKEITEGFISVISEKYPEVDVIVGVATGGLPQAALVAEGLNLPLAYVRPEKKSHGKTNQVEGRIEKNQKVVVIEDLISTGGSSIKAVDALKAMDIDVLGVVAVFTYNLAQAKEAFKDVALSTLSDYETLIKVANQEHYIEKEDQEILLQWHRDPYILMEK